VKKYLLSLSAILISYLAFAQEQTSSVSVQMAETMRSSGKIYVVVAVLSIILIGLILFLISIDRKIRKLEKEMENEYFKYPSKSSDTSIPYSFKHKKEIENK